MNAAPEGAPADSLSDDGSVLRAGELQRYLARPEVYKAEILFDDISVVETRVDPRDPVHLRAQLVQTYDRVVVSGTLRATWTAPCRRCNAEIRTSTEWDFSETFATEAVEGESYPLGDESLDLRGMVRDQVVLQLPLAPLCRDDCKGICSTCGADFNEDDCGCESAAPDPRWDVLKDLDLG
ncbi:MAG: DUF177 domain-containing protein [Acidimicrobiales bacterium]